MALPRLPSSPLIIRVPFFLLLGFNKGTQKKKGKRVLLGHLATRGFKVLLAIIEIIQIEMLAG